MGRRGGEWVVGEGVGWRGGVGGSDLDEERGNSN